jgi:glycosyltransferase involved in cell wall biosynthesis
MPRHSSQSVSASQAVVSVIVPARNEEACLERCLNSIVEQSGVPFELIIVDDASTDRTPRIADAFARIKDCPVIIQNPNLVRVVPVSARAPLPPHWTGKVNGLWTGLQHAAGNWILFTDADTFHKPGSLARAVAEAGKHSAALLSYSPQQEVHSFAERALMPVVFSELASTFRPREVSDPASPAAAANGQYLLITRDALTAIGGLDHVAHSLLEDVALATAVKASGRPLRFRYAADAVSTRMYRTWEALREGWTKNLVLLFPGARRLAIKRALEFAIMSLAPIVAAIAWFLGAHLTASLAAAVAVPTSLNFFFRVRKAHFDPLSTLLAVAGVPVFVYLLLRSARLHRLGGVTWKGRSYSGSEAKISAAESKPQSQESRAATARARG